MTAPGTGSDHAEFACACRERLAGMSELQVVAPTESHLIAVAEQRFDWAVSNGHAPIQDKSTFTSAFVNWAKEHDETHQCLVVIDGDDNVMGFGFLAMTQRVPAPHRDKRWSADIQAVFVPPEHRNSGIGSRLLEALVETARQQGAEHLTVHSSQGALTAYQRAGFTADPLMMYQEGASPTY
jgi:GNAT superfamily N-acetyltransferase